MTPQLCLAARASLGWSRQDLAAATGLAAPILRLYEAGALDGFADCEAAIADALAAGEAARSRPLPPARTWARGRRRAHEGALVCQATSGIDPLATLRTDPPLVAGLTCGGAGGGVLSAWS